jgi:hypothetical protein
VSKYCYLSEQLRSKVTQELETDLCCQDVSTAVVKMIKYMIVFGIVNNIKTSASFES